MKETKTGYKVVYKDSDGSLWSAWSNCAGIEYKVGEWVRPAVVSGHKNGPLSLFQTRQDAVHWVTFAFQNWLDFFPIYECKYIPSSDNKVWTYYKGQYQELPLGDAPNGTVLADAIMLMEEVI